ncbi:MAG: plasmid mobilization relaxosome protein MobC [Paraburkholderia sp.]|nr:plasmid mobilization relaxosome protein MobC [Paraburkholderia sp.]TAM00374.1 MAG: plasmid mobilization relaxosome protein MobC [Paraburkholderia sp.]
MARTKVSADQQLSKRVGFRLSEAEYAAYVSKVGASGLTPSEFFRQCVLTNRTQIVQRPRATPERQRIVYVINKTGNNINQLAHVANSARVSGRLSESTFVALVDELEMITQLLKAHLHRVD